MSTDPQLVAAVNLLIKEEKAYSNLVREMTKLIEDGPVGFRYEIALEPLNTLVDLGRRDRDAFERVLKFIDGKRQARPNTAKVDYQRDLMRERRQRMAKAMLLHEARTGPLKGDERKAQMASIRERWTRAQRQFIVDREATSAAERRQAHRDFWEMVDRHLDANLTNLQRTSAVA